MTVMVPSTDLIDPLHDHSELSLLPRTFEGLKRNEKLKQHTLQSVMKALAVNSPNNLSEQAKIVLNNSSELQTLDMQSDHKDSPARVNIRPQERRPALGRKRARFSLKPSTSQTTVVGGVNLNIDKLQDPEEYFLAFEKHERAEEELRKQRGDVPTDLTRHIPTTAPRSRRPGISGRRASHGRRFSSLVANLDEAIGPSGKVSEVDTPSQSNKTSNLATTDEHGASQEKELADNGFMGATQVDSVAEEENNGGILDELLSQGGTNLDGDEAVKYFQERLQIKPFNLEELCLPEVNGVRKSDGKVSLKQLPRQKRALSEVHNAAARVKGKKYLETQQLAESSNISLDFPTPPRNPYSSRHLSDGIRAGKAFLPPGIEDNSPVRDSTHDEGVEKGALLLHVDSNYEPVEVEVDGNEPNLRFVSMTTEELPADTSMVLDNTQTADSAHSIDLKDGKVGGMQPDALGKLTNPIDTHIVLDKPGTDDAATSLDPVEGRADPVETYMDVDKLVTDDSAHLLNPTLDNLHKSSQGMDISSNGLPDGFEDAQTVGSNQAEPSCEGLSIEDLHCSGSPGTSDPTINEDHAKGRSRIIDTLPGENNQESPGELPNALNKQKGSPRGGRKRPLVHRKSPTGKLLNAGSKQKSRARRRSSFRKSLPGAGTRWEDGQRKSTRIRMRPLEFWRGERFLHGRVHESLLTVIACKYASPGKGDPKPKLKVQSFVPDTYKDLVGKVANDGLPASGL